MPPDRNRPGKADPPFLERRIDSLEAQLKACTDALSRAHRQARVEAALEHIRARAMEMHHSNELSEVAALVSEELAGVNIATLRCGISIINAAHRVMEMWFVSRDEAGKAVRLVGKVPVDTHEAFLGAFEAWQRRDPMFVIDLADVALIEYHRAVREAYPIPRQGAHEEPSTRQVIHFLPTPEGGLGAVATAPLDEGALAVLRRFADVFSFTYTRYLELRRAETRILNAIRQASVDRLRAEIAMMRTTADLERIPPLIWQDLTAQGVSFIRCGIFIIDDEAGTAELYLSNPEGTLLAVLRLEMDAVPILQAIRAHWRRRAAYTEQWDAEQIRNWVRFLQDRGLIVDDKQYLGDAGEVPSLMLHYAPFAQGVLYVGSTAPLSEEEMETVQSLARAFTVAYARYEDFSRLETKHREVEEALHDLKATQAQLVHAEKMASLGALTAGIAHEIKNPLNFINNFADLIRELVGELQDELDKDPPVPRADLHDILADLHTNAGLIGKHGRRADEIVRAMMAHAREGKRERVPTDLNALASEYLGLAYHGKRAALPRFNATLEKDFDPAVGTISVMPQELGRVLLNLLTNAFDAVYEKSQRTDVTAPPDAGAAYAPTVRLATRRTEAHVELRVEDNGPGVPPDHRGHIFEPFFTTKEAGAGTGLGLSLSYDIVTSGHGGTLSVEDAVGGGAAFIIRIPG